MCMKNLFSILCFVLAASFSVVSAQQFPQCGKSLFFTPNDAYDTNRRLIFSTLASKVSSQDGFYNSSVGEESDKVYAMGMCVPGSKPKVCSDCIQAASGELLRTCTNQTDSFEWRTSGSDTLCFVRHSNRFFFDSSGVDPYIYLCNHNNVTGDLTEFNSVWDEFIKRMIIAASTSSTPKNYAADFSQPIGFQRIYAFMQCVPGISQIYCDDCLRKSVLVYQQNCKGLQGINVRRPVCFFEWEFYPFYDAFADQKSPPPQPALPPPPGPSTPGRTKKSTNSTIIAIAVVAAIIVALLLALGFVFCWRRKSDRTIIHKIDDGITNTQPLQFDFKTLNAATDSFSPKNKIGRGGFGVVYKGILPNGTEIAVKRLSRNNSVQGLKEFKNEVIVLAGLQHTNLVRILGFCLEGEEQILVYEFLPNKSLDYFLFDPVKQDQLNWSKRYDIIGGITRGMLYLHHDSNVKIIHRDLKASNILLDKGMKPKIADFGMARIFGNEQTRADTSKIAGTFGYMAPEYVMHGQISMKSDVYSFGILVLEIISGRMNIRCNETDGSVDSLVTHAWRLWRKRSPLGLLDPTFGDNYIIDDVTRCIHIGLLCVQEDPAYRPTFSTIILMLSNSSMTLPEPREARGFISE